MKVKKVTIGDDVARILQTAVFSGNILRFEQKLERDEYVKVNKVLELLGAKWKRNLAAHEFPKGTDAAGVIAETLGTGSVVDEKKTYQAFYTPRAVADEVARYASCEGKLTLEPSAGGAALCEAALRAGASEVVCVEINPTAAEALRQAGYKVYEQDFLTFFPAKKFERIVMNPPFTANQDIKHVEHAFNHCLAPGGILVSVMPFSPERKKFQSLIETAESSMTYELGEGAFSESGTQVKTMIVTLAKAPESVAEEIQQSSKQSFPPVAASNSQTAVKTVTAAFSFAKVEGGSQVYQPSLF